MKNLFQDKDSDQSYSNEEPLRAELFNGEQLKRFGKTLAETHTLSKEPAKEYLLKRLESNEAILHSVRKLLTDSVKSNQLITPAGEWLLDNFYLLEEHIRSAKIHFPKGYSEDLPRLAGVSWEGSTRIYDITLQKIAHSDGRIDIERLGEFLEAYQSVTFLKLGELWAIPIMLRLGLIENIRRVSARVAIDRVDKNLADHWAKKMFEIIEEESTDLILVIAEMARSNPPMSAAFVSELIRQLRGKGPDLAMVLNWIEQQLSKSGLTSTELVNAENQTQAIDQVSISNSINSLRELGLLDWSNFVEAHSMVEQTLRQDQAGIYASMDFSTRDRYRHVVERLAKKSDRSEVEVARIAIALTRKNVLKKEDLRTSHVGYYLIGRGVIETKKQAKTREPIFRKLRYLLQRISFQVYLFLILLITFFVSTLLIKVELEIENNWFLGLIILLTILSASQLAVSVVNFLSTLFVKPRLLPRMDFSKSIPAKFRTLVVVPAMLSNEKIIENLVDALEVRFLANRNDNLHFGLLTDFTDAAHESLPEDQALVDLAQHRIEELNKKYKRKNNDLFYLFHRPRLWNPKENCWMGYERKRGKLLDLNSLLRGEAKDRFSVIIGNPSIFPQVKYVITLDADTRLPLGSAWKLVGAMAHPLNHAWYDDKKKRVTKGYGILQPRVSVSLSAETGSLYKRMHGDEPGIDPYTRASSDVYQDLFTRGSFIGKGIYDVDILNKVLGEKFPENRILSHDLLEGAYVRSGLLSDVQLYEEYPNSYREDMKRVSRWIRGDWQILQWIFPLVPGADKHWHKNPISALSRWKIFDNIRRSLVPIALTALIIIGWITLPSTLLWTAAVSLIIVVPIIITSIWNTIRKPKDVVLIHHIKNSVHSIKEVFIKTSFTLISLPYEACANVMTIARTLWRLLISKKRLLQWDVSTTKLKASEITLMATYSFMWMELLLAIVVLVTIILLFPIKLFIAGPILLLWIAAPIIIWWTSQPLKKQAFKLTTEKKIFLRKMARKTWSFFEELVTLEDNWLPPDNIQEQPVALVAHRTSPTNTGLSLLANITARDFGYITTTQFIDRTANTMRTLQRMERFNGHFYNWYDTQSLEPLLPKYISTVDSGNLVGHLLILKQKLLAIPNLSILNPKLFHGLRDTLSVLSDTLDGKNSGVLKQCKIDLETACDVDDITYDEAIAHLKVVEKDFAIVDQALETDTSKETHHWKDALKNQLTSLRDELEIFIPGVALQTAPSEFVSRGSMKTNTTFSQWGAAATAWQKDIEKYKAITQTTTEDNWIDKLETSLARSIVHVEKQLALTETLAKQCGELADIKWEFLFNRSNNLFTIGFNVKDNRLDAGYYDLLASEARLGSFACIAQEKVPVENWFALGRLLTNVEGEPILLSWSGSMFEYLMPLLVMPTYENTLLDQTCKAAVAWQIHYGKKTGKPWGISESGYNMINASSHYQYRAFGAPGLGLKRGLEEDSVIAPYASALALMVAPKEAYENLKLLRKEGLEGRYGFYEAVDYTPSRLQRGQASAIVYSYMSHHQGMSLLSMAYLLHDKPMQKLFEAEPQFKAALLLLQERIPRATVFYAHTTDIADVGYVAKGTESREIDTPNTLIPEVQLLSNGRYHVMVTNAGGGYSRWKDLAVTRWREDGTRDNWGAFCYIRDIEDNTYWSNTHQPTLNKEEKYEVVFSIGRADFHSTHNEIETHTEMVVSPEDDIEMRRILVSNNSSRRRKIEVTSYSEVVLAPVASDIMQPLFNNLFVQMEILPPQHAILCKRRPRSVEEPTPVMFHLMTLQEKEAEEISYETDRMEFIGRGNTTVNPKAMKTAGPLAGNQGSVLDPIVAIRYVVTLDPGKTVTFDMVTGVGDTREICQNLIGKYQDKLHSDRVFELAWTHSQVVLRQINATEAEAQLFGQLASSILFNNTAFRADPSVLINNHRQQSELWAYSVSGDLPIVLLRIEKQSNMQLAKQLVKAHSYWRTKGLIVDLVIWHEGHSGYRQVFQNEIQAIIPDELRDRPGGIFVRASEQVSYEDQILFQTTARICISDNGGSLTDQVNRTLPAKVEIPYFPSDQKIKIPATSIPIPEDLTFYNGVGGFNKEGNEYVMIVDNKTKTPVPWVNIIANPDFGSVISESGSAYTWTENAHEFRLTPWKNDPVSDTSGEAFYLRDEVSGHFWSTSLLPAGGKTPYIVRHGFGYSIFEHIEDGIYSEMIVYVDLEAAVKFTVIKIRNQSGRSRKISATGYAEWVLDNNRSKSMMHIRTEVDPDSGALIAKNPYNIEFNKRVAFFDVDHLKKSITADRTEFLGRNGTLQRPDAMLRKKFSGKTGLALDPCAAIQVPIELLDGEEQRIIFRLGAGKDANEASRIVHQFRGSEVADESLEKVRKYWTQTVGTLQVETPDMAINMMANGWLTYQTLSSRLWGRSGFYQSGGAFGFRDQLQDVLSLLYAAPELARKQILLSASRQFKEGDVQHWWHPPVGRGVRTRISDDFLWLPLVTARYVLHTGDREILNETVSFLEGRPLNPDEESYFDLPFVSGTSASLYEHCVRAIKHAWRFGEHGLPLIGTGDWNDGYDKVGNHGKGESVWMGFFLYDILIQFGETARLNNDSAFADECNHQAKQLKENIERNAWDGKWYKRAWFDNGTPLGSSVNEECKIDSIAQSWSVLSEVADSNREHEAMESAYQQLVQKDVGIIKLLAPPFDKSALNPGYIKGYVPGVRENGGQYTHAAVWLIMAFAKLGDKKRVWELLKMINPINHGNTLETIATYKVEPYVLAADVYAGTQHAGRGGWTWYTGSAGWLYRLIIESFLGVEQQGDKLKVNPCIPEEWKSFKVRFRYKETVYDIEVTQTKTAEEMSITVDDVKQKENWIPLMDDGVAHHVQIIAKA
ncbi:MAG: cyclic beta 1-2 glucan synthetase [Cyclobacteriaceae bacterium]|nr:cyclic beta 1-2 glucan synthetase [Cyclobacteriaceae bacterium]